MTVLVACLGVGAGVGLLLIVVGLRRTTLVLPSQLVGGLSRQTWTRIGLCLGVAAVVGAATRWPVGAALAGLAAWTLPTLLGGDRAQAQALARAEAVASWAEMLRDNLGAAAGLEQAIIAAAQVPPAAIRDEVQTLALDIRSGKGLVAALARFRTSLNDPIGDLVVRALSQAAHRQGSRLTDLLSELAELARKRAGVRLRVAAGRARVEGFAAPQLGTTRILRLSRSDSVLPAVRRAT
jgi:tight adherence protein B